MNSDFVKNAKPKTTQSCSFLTWVHLWCKIQAKKKTRQKRTLERHQTRATVVRDDAIHSKTLEDYPDDFVLGKFMETTWNGNHVGGGKYDEKRSVVN